MPSESTRQPRRVLILSADMGEGHNATGRALEEAALARWPGVTVRWLDALDVMGPGIGPLFRSIYVANVERTPWLYEFFYLSIRRWRWFAESSKHFVGAWCGRRLAPRVAAFDPDVILSTYPLGTAGLAWLRRHRGLRVPIGAWVSDFSPHPFWVYRHVDLNLVMHEVAADAAREWVPGVAAAVSAPPVVSAFVPAGKAGARAAMGLPRDAFIALVSCGSLGFGSVESAARTLLAASEKVVVVVACGRNDALRERLLADGDHGGRLRALGWVDTMPALTAASDVMVTNAGGATSLEALACGRPVLMYRPIAAHGRANARLMADAGLATVCEDDGTLAVTVRDLVANPDRLAAMSEAALAHTSGHSVADGLDALLDVAAAPVPAGTGRRLRAEDALFVHVQNRAVPQQVGAVLVLDRKEDGSRPTREDAAYLVAAAPGLFGRIETGSWLRHPRWRPDPTVTALDLVDEVDVTGPDGHADLDSAMDDFFSVPLDGTSGTGRARLVHGVEGNRSALLITLHHATADGIAVTGALVGRARGQEFISEAPSDQAAPTMRDRLTAVRELGRGVWTLARAGRATPSELNGPVRTAERHHAHVDLPIGEVRLVARALQTRTTDLATGLVGESLYQVLHAHGTRSGPDHLRVMMPRSTRTTSTFRTAGNRTGAASVDLPTGPMPLARRVELTRTATQDQVDSAAPHAAHAVVRVLGVLPPFLHRLAARAVYRSTWFNLIASVLPGARSPVFVRGSRVAAVYPVLALAPGVRLSVGVMTWADLLTVCFTGDAESARTVDALAESFRAAFKESRARVPEAVR